MDSPPQGLTPSGSGEWADDSGASNIPGQEQSSLAKSGKGKKSKNSSGDSPISSSPAGFPFVTRPPSDGLVRTSSEILSRSSRSRLRTDTDPTAPPAYRPRPTQSDPIVSVAATQSPISTSATSSPARGRANGRISGGSSKKLKKPKKESKVIVEAIVSSIWNKAPEKDILEQLDELKDRGSDINIQNERGQTILYSAARWGLVEVVTALLHNKKIDPNIPTAQKSIALHVAGFEGHAMVVALLIMGGSDPHYRNLAKVKAWQDARGAALKVYTIYNSEGRAGIWRNWPETRAISIWNPDYKNLIYKLEFDHLVKKSQEFQSRISFPVTSNTAQLLGSSDERKIIIGEQATQTKIILHYKLKEFFAEFLKIKLKDGTQKEKQIYTDMKVEEFVLRLITKRPLTFYTHNDVTTLRDGKALHSPSDWLSVGQNEEGGIKMEDYMTYDEISLAALIGISSPTYFINPGSRNNAGKPPPENPESYPFPGVYIGLVGARFEKRLLMETQYILTFPSQNHVELSPLQQLWQTFLDCKLPRFDDITLIPEADRTDFPVVRSVHFMEKPIFFNVPIYKQRMALSIEAFLVDANARGEEAKRRVFCHVVGLGLGIWQVSPNQAVYILDVFASCLEKYKLPWVGNLDFSWFPDECPLFCGPTKDGQKYKNSVNSVHISFSHRNPADLLVGDDVGKLLVAMYAWDGNSYPGNEYWTGMLTTSGDPAAASCSLIQELQNPEINGHVLNNIFWTEPEWIERPTPTPLTKRTNTPPSQQSSTPPQSLTSTPPPCKEEEGQATNAKEMTEKEKAEAAAEESRRISIALDLLVGLRLEDDEPDSN